MANIKQSNNLKIPFYNPWLENASFRFLEGELKKRDKFFELKKYLKRDLIVSLIGLRRTGKTTVLKQLINDLFENGVDHNHVFFYEFDEEINNLDEILSFYFDNILKEDLYTTSCYVFLDELQFAKGWQTVLKRYYDINPRIKFIISGSTHLYLHKNTKESLAGRIIDLKILPFAWFEFLNFKYNQNYQSPLLTIFEDDFSERVKENSKALLHTSDFKTFISYGEFPYFFKGFNAFELEEYYQESILDKIFLKDIKFFDVEDVKAFTELYQILNLESANEFNLNNLSREISITSVTVKRYIEILQKMFLYDYLYKYENSKRKQIRSFKKGYSNSLNLLKSSSGVDYWHMDKSDWGHIVETFVYNELQKSKLKNIYFYNDTKKKKEVDFILEKGNKLVPIEVKSSDDIEKINIKNLLYFIEKNKLFRGVVIYGGLEIKIKKVNNCTIEFIPFYLI